MDLDESLTPIEETWRGRMSRHNSEGCLDGQAMLELVERGRGANDYASRMDHIATCPRCQAILLELKQTESLSGQYERARWSWRKTAVWVLVPAAVALLAVDLAVLSRAPGGNSVSPGQVVGRSELAVPAKLTQPEPDAHPDRTSEPHVGGTRGDGQQAPNGILAHPPRPRISHDMRNAIAWARKELRGGPERTRGGGPDNVGVPKAILLKEPVLGNHAVKETRPTFRWKLVEKTGEYTVSLTEDTGELNPHGFTGKVVGNAWRPPADLRRGAAYRLQLTVSSESQSSSYGVRILTDREAAVLRAASADRTRRPDVYFGVLYHLKMFGDAKQWLVDTPALGNQRPFPRGSRDEWMTTLSKEIDASRTEAEP